MKKLHFSLMAILFALFSMVSFTACSSSDDDDAPSQDDIKTNCIGMWQTTHISGWGYDDTEDENLIKVDKDIPEEDSERILFKGDGTYKWYWYYNNGWQPGSSAYTYEVSGNKIILYDDRGDIDITYTVVSFKNNTVVLEVTLEEGPQYKQRITCKRVN
uniref:lipocalin family protein n=1 Tax=Prevotella sp. TaxID=59823 RepID=UPI003FED3D68